MVLEGITLPVKKDDIDGKWVLVPSNGISGTGSKVLKCFPNVPHWKGEATYHILDDTITESVFRRHLEKAGMFIGIGTWRPRNKGLWGRYKVNSIDWQEIA